MPVPDVGRRSHISAGGQGSCPIPKISGYGGVLQVDNKACSGLAADQGGAWVQCTATAGMSCPGQRRPWRQGLTPARYGDRRGYAGWRPRDMATELVSHRCNRGTDI